MFQNNDDEDNRELQASLRNAFEANRDAVNIEAKGVESLKVLYQVANGHSGQCRYIAAFLLGLYNGARFPFDLTDLRCIDRELYEHCMAVLHMDARVCRQEVHCYFEDGGAKFEALAREWQLTDYAAMRSQLETYQELYGPLDSEQP